jgi:hypothetical protein
MVRYDTSPSKITFGEMRGAGTIGILVYCADYKCSHSIAMAADRWSDDVRLSDIEPRFVCKVCGKRGADIRPTTNQEALISRRVPHQDRFRRPNRTTRRWWSRLIT